jgi:hypothetical protein
MTDRAESGINLSLDYVWGVRSCYWELILGRDSGERYMAFKFVSYHRNALWTCPMRTCFKLLESLFNGVVIRMASEELELWLNYPGWLKAVIS